MVRLAYLDCFSGISGDMLLGALLDVGWPPADLQAVVASLGLENVTVRATRVQKHNLWGTQVTLDAPEAQPLRHPADLIALIERAGLSAAARGRAVAVIQALVQAEAQVHGIPLEEVHFHEVGAVDTLVDVVGAAAGFEALGVGRIVCAPLPWSRGVVKIAHGVIPLPGPAVTALLTGVPVVGVDVDGELVTPTGAALAVRLADAFGLMPAMTVTGVGYGAGVYDWPQRPNLLRLVLGESPA